jgi:uncharacterized protein DUF5719
MRHLWSRRLTLPGLVLLALALVYVVAWMTGSARSSVAASSTAPQTVPVTAVTRDCPPPGPGTGQAHVALLAVPPQAATVKAAQSPSGGVSGGTVLTAVPSAASPGKASPGTKASAGTTAGPAAPDVPALLSPPRAAAHAGTEVTATGELAEGFTAEQAAADGTGTVTCAHPNSDMWFVGTGTDAGASTVWLYMTNTGSMAASVGVTVLTDSGVQSGQDNQVTVGPHQYLGMNLASVAKGSTVLAVEVQTSSGQVAADLWQGGGSGGTWLPVAGSPATQLVIPGLTAAAGAAKLVVAVPGGQDAQLRVTALTAQGKVQPFGSMPADAPAGAASAFTLNSLGASAAALVISSNVPVTAGVQVPGKGIGEFTAASAPISVQGVVAGNPSGRGATVGLVLSAPAATGRAAITVIPASNPERSLPTPQQTLTVQSGHTTQVAVSPPKGSKGPFAIVVTPLPGSGPLYAARVVMSGGNGLSGTLQSLLPVVSALSAIQLPSADENYSAVLP